MIKRSLLTIKALIIAGGLSVAIAGQETSYQDVLIHVRVPSDLDTSFPVRIRVSKRKNSLSQIAIILHGTSSSAAHRSEMKIPYYDKLEKLLIRKGFIVAVPLRPGYGNFTSNKSTKRKDSSSLHHWEDYGSCGNPDYHKAALKISDVVSLTIEGIKKSLKRSHYKILLVGHSGGAMGALMYASRYPSNVLGVINFSGGFGGRSYGIANNNCAPDRLKSLVRDIGSRMRIPSLWLYAQNDSYFGPELAEAMAKIFEHSGAKLEFHFIPPLIPIGHGIIISDKASKYWYPILISFIDKLYSTNRGKAIHRGGRSSPW